MPDEHYLYAFTWADCLLTDPGQGVDPHFAVELVPDGRLAAVASCVDLDQFDVARLAGKTAEDLNWLSRIAVRHNEIVAHVASQSPVLPLRLGTIFNSRASLLAKLAQHATTVTNFLHELGERQEWAAKIYVDRHWAKATLAHPAPPPPHFASRRGAGAAYLKQKQTELQNRREFQSHVQREVTAVANTLEQHADRCRIVRNLSANLTGREEKMAWNAAFLLPRSANDRWLAKVEQLRNAVRPKGLLLEVTGPWPAYHFCPELNI